MSRVRNAHLNFPESSVTPSNCFFCPNNSPTHKDSSFIAINNTKTQQILTFERLNQQFFFLFSFEKQLKWLIDYPDSCRLIFYRSIRLIIVALLPTTAKLPRFYHIFFVTRTRVSWKNEQPVTLSVLSVLIQWFMLRFLATGEASTSCLAHCALTRSGYRLIIGCNFCWKSKSAPTVLTASTTFQQCSC